MLPCAFAPLSLWPLAIVIPALLFWLWYGQTPRQALWIGFLFGVGLFGVGVSWVYVAIHVYGYTSAFVAGLLTAIFVAFLALVPALQGWLSAYCLRYLPDTGYRPMLAYAWVFPTLWVVFEWLRGWLFTGFPWLNLGYSQIDSPLAGFAPLLGVYGLSALLVFSASGLLVLLQGGYARVAAIMLLILIWSVGGYLTQTEWTQPVDDPISVAIVQGNQDQLTKWDENKIRSQMQSYLDLSEPYWAEHDVIMWPENALTILYADTPLDFKLTLLDKVHTHQTDLILGLPYGDYKTYYSSLLVVGEQEGVYHKRHLVPFGEFVPLQELLRGLVNFFDLPMSGFSAGDKQQTHLVAAGQPLAPSICYEDAFGEELIDFLPEATILVNGSNNAWYGDSWAPHQHLQIARMRAVETGRMLMRATTNGISAVVDHHGQVLQASPQFAQHVISAEVQPRQGATPYVLFGNWPVLGFIGMSLLLMCCLPFFTRADFDLAKA
jgi:apolipoprotein N-acyltransferase